MNRTEHGSVNGIPYRLVHARVCDMTGRGEKAYRWFLYIRGDYVGEFLTRKAANSYLYLK